MTQTAASGAAVVFVPIASPAASTAHTSSPGARSDAAHSAAQQTSQASADTSVVNVLSCETSSGLVASAATASAAIPLPTPRLRRPDHPASTSSASIRGFQSEIATKLRPIPLAQVASSSVVSG